MISGETPFGTLQQTALVWTLLAADAQAIARTLESAEIPTSIHSDAASFCQALPHCLMAIITIEVLSPSHLQMVKEAISRQPTWSDAPIALLTGRAAPSLPAETLQALGNVTVLERPLRQSSLLSLAQSAARARRKQFEVSELLQRNETLIEQLHRAMTETHHRVKNNLQLIAALVDLSAMDNKESVPLEQLLRLSSHITALAAIHDILTEETKNQSDGAQLSAKAVLERLLPLMNQTVSGRQIQFEIDDISLPTRHCASLALITNELVANALKHARSDVQVRFHVEPPQAALIVEDNGPGFTPDFDPIVSAHTGLDLALNLSGHDLNGVLHFGNRAQGGGRVHLSFPVLVA